MIYSLFASPSFRAYQGTPENPNDSSLISDSIGGESIRYNLLYKKNESLPLDDGDSRVLTLPESTFSLTEWSIMVLKVIGKARLTTTGKDYDNTTNINAYMDTYGTSRYPGYVLLSTYNVSAFTVTGQEDGTVVEVFYGVSCADADARYL